MESLRQKLDEGETVPTELHEAISRITTDPLFTDVYFQDARFDICQKPYTMIGFTSDTAAFAPVLEPDEIICDGLSMARTRMRVLAQEYKWNTRAIHDSHRTMTVVMFNPADREVVGYIIVRINEDYLVNEFLGPEIMSRFGSVDEAGAVIWLYDWTKTAVLASNGPTDIVRERDDYIQRFQNMLEDWHLRISFKESPEILASRESFIRNLALLAGGVILLLGSLVLMYVTAQKERELGMRQASFLANVTHELKTPLAVMQAAGENLADGRVNTAERLKSYGRHIYEESIRLRRMIEKLLDVARNEAGQLILKKVKCRLDELTREYIREHDNYLKSMGADIVLKVDDDIPPVKIDMNSFDTILGNLVENAIKYSPDEKYLGIRVFSNHKKVYVEVEDRGKGIPKEAQKLIFDKFYRVEDTLTARTKGHGLGLAIVKNLTEANGGHVSVRSQVGKGSIFTIEFPVMEEAITKHPINGTGQTIKEEEYVA